MNGAPSASIRAAFSPDGQRVLTTSEGGTARVWEAATGKQLAQMNGGDYLYSAAFSPDGERVVTSEGVTAAIYKVVSSSDVKKLFSKSP
jgi:WD40 repeat protein